MSRPPKDRAPQDAPVPLQQTQRALALERMIVGACILAPDLINENAIPCAIEPDDFLHPMTRAVYDAMLTMSIGGEPWDLQKAFSRVPESMQTTQMGAFLGECLNSVTYTGMAEDGARELANIRRRQRLKVALVPLVETLSTDCDLQPVVARILSAVNQASGPAHYAPDPIPCERNPPPEGFPYEVFPPWLAAYCKSVSRELQVAPEACGILAILAASAALQAKVSLAVTRKYHEPCVLYGGVVLPPANRKTALLDRFMRPIQDREIELRKLFADGAARREVEIESLTGHLKAMSRNVATGVPDAMDKAVALKQRLNELTSQRPRQMLLADFTPEALGEILHRYSHAIISTSEPGFLDRLSRYTQGPPDADLILSAWDGSAFKLNRVGRGDVSVATPYLNIVITPQMDRLAGAFKACRGIGLPARFLFVVPQSRVGARNIRNSDPPTPAESDSFNHYMTTLLDLPLHEDSKPDHIRPWFVTLSDEAREVSTAFEEEIEGMLSPSGVLRDMPDWGGKFAGAMRRIAVVLHALNHCHTHQWWLRPVDARTMTNACTVARTLLPHAMFLYRSIFGAEFVTAADAIAKWIRNANDGLGLTLFTSSDAMRSLGRRYRDRDIIDAACDHLLAEGVLTEATTSTETPRNGRTVRRFFVSPAFFERKK